MLCVSRTERWVLLVVNYFFEKIHTDSIWFVSLKKTFSCLFDCCCLLWTKLKSQQAKVVRVSLESPSKTSCEPVDPTWSLLPWSSQKNKLESPCILSSQSLFNYLYILNPRCWNSALNELRTEFHFRVFHRTKENRWSALKKYAETRSNLRRQWSDERPVHPVHPGCSVDIVGEKHYAEATNNDHQHFRKQNTAQLFVSLKFPDCSTPKHSLSRISFHQECWIGEWCEPAGADGFAFVVQNEGRKIVGASS